MIKKISPLTAILASLLMACNNSTDSPKKAEADSLYEEVMEGHNIGMAKMPHLSKMQQQANRILDSISQLPESARQAATFLQAKVDSAKKDLVEAEAAMNTWMENFKFDSAKDDLEKRVQYLKDEKIRVNEMKEKILKSLRNADSLFNK